jgi:hypothetical protein
MEYGGKFFEGRGKDLMKIVVLGAGQLGSRHLQGLAKLRIENEIYVVDPMEASLKTAKERFEEFNSKFNRRITYSTTIDFEDKIDIAIVATNSLERLSAIENLLKKCRVDYLILEKFLFTNLNEFDKAEQLIQNNCVNAWVNCPRRMYDIYKTIKDEIKNEKSILYSYSGYNLRPGSNSVHHLDLFSFFINDSDIDIDCNSLDSSILPAKRNGYVEFSGLVKASKGKHNFILNSYNDGSSPAFIEISTPNVKYLIREDLKEYNKLSSENNWSLETKSFDYPMQSNLTNLIVEDIYNKKSSDLPLYENSFEIHKNFLKAIFNFYKNIRNEEISSCPIT